MKKMAVAGVALGAFSMIGGCGGRDQKASAQAPAKSPDVKADAASLQNVLPMAVGNQWVYEVRGKSVTASRGNQSGNAEATFKMVDVSADRKKARIDVSVNGAPSEREAWEYTADGLYQTAAGKDLIPFNPPEPAVPFDMPLHKIFKWEGTGQMQVGIGAGSGQYTNKFIGPELVDTENGQVWALCVETVAKISVKVKVPTKQPGQTEIKTVPGVEQTDFWWRPGVGFVRSYTKVVVLGVQQTEETLTLKSHQLVK